MRRLLAIALLLDSHSREAAAVANGMTRQTLRDWVHRFNADGVSGLRSRTSPGRPPALNETLVEELRSIVLEGPDPERHRVVRWRRIDLCEEIASRWSVTVCEQTMGKWLRQLGMTRLQPVRGRCGSADEILHAHDDDGRLAAAIDNKPLVVLGREIHDLSELGTGHANASGYHCGRGRIPAVPDNDNPPPSPPFFLIVADYDRGFFTVEGPMTDDRPWNDLARHVRDHRQFHVACGPTGPDRDKLAAEFRKTNKLAGAPPGSVMRPRQ